MKQKTIMAAADHLENKGYEILDVNYKTDVGDIDIVAMFGDVLVFVKTYYSKDLSKGLPDGEKDYKKVAKMELAAALYLRDHEYVGKTVRFDAVGILYPGGDGALVRHHANAIRQ